MLYGANHPKIPAQGQSALLSHSIPSRLAALIQLNTGMQILDLIMARLDELVLDHYIPHLWVRKNSLTDRKTLASSRCVPMLV